MRMPCQPALHILNMKDAYLPCLMRSGLSWFPAGFMAGVPESPVRVGVLIPLPLPPTPLCNVRPETRTHRVRCEQGWSQHVAMRHCASQELASTLDKYCKEYPWSKVCELQELAKEVAASLNPIVHVVQVTKLRLSCYLVLLSSDSKTR